MKRVRIVLADDHPLIRFGLRAALREAEDIELVGEAVDGWETQRLCVELQPDILLLDLNMPGPTAVETISYLKEKLPQLRTLILTAYFNEGHVRSLISLGISGYILKDEDPSALVRAIHAVIVGDTWFSRIVVSMMTGQNPQTIQQSKEISPIKFSFSEREMEIMQFLAQGMSNEQIAVEACISERTVRHYVEQIMEKLSVSNRTKAVVIAIHNGWVKL